jgi:hypothetical protein
VSNCTACGDEDYLFNSTCYPEKCPELTVLTDVENRICSVSSSSKVDFGTLPSYLPLNRFSAIKPMISTLNQIMEVTWSLVEADDSVISKFFQGIDVHAMNLLINPSNLIQVTRINSNSR